MNDTPKMSELASLFVAKLGDKNNDDAKRQRAHLELKQFLGLDFLELTPEQADSFLDGFNEPIRRLVETSEPGPIKGAILAIECIVSLESKNKIVRLNRFVNFLRNLLRNRQLVVLEAVACAVCRICVHALAFTTDLVNDQITKSLEWMRDSNLNQLAALYVLRELAQSAPNHFLLHAQSFFDGIFVPLRHKEPEIREAAGSALFAALCVLVEREARDPASVSSYWVACVEEFAKPKVSESQRDDRTHGQLLILLQLLRLANTHFDLQWRQCEKFATSFSVTSNSPSTAELAIPTANTILTDPLQVYMQNENSSSEIVAFPESRACRRIVQDNLAFILTFIQHAMIQRPATIQRAVLQICPRLAAFSLTAFRPQLERTVVHMTNLAKKGEPSVKPCALTAMAMLILAVGPEILRHRAVIYECISSALQKSQTSDRAFLCLSALAQVCASPAIDEVTRLIDQSITLGLTPGLPICFRAIAIFCSDLERKIKDGIVNLVHGVLQVASSPVLARVGALERRASTVAPLSAVFSANTGNTFADYTQVKLALQAIQLFRFDKETSRDLLGRVVAVCLEHEKSEVRIDAVPVVMRLMQLDIELLEAYLRQYHRYGQETLRFVTSRLRDLVRLCLCDSEPIVRLVVLHALFTTERMDPFLAQQEILDMLFLTLNDDDGLVRREAVALLGRLCNMNCGAILPKLRSVLLHNLLELEHLGSARLKESAVEAVSWLLSCCSHIALAYAQPAIATLLRLLQDEQQSASLIVTSLQSIGTLARVAPLAVSLHCNDLVQIFVKQLAQPATAAGARRRAALGAFCKLMTYVPQKSNIHRIHPALLDSLLTLIRTETDKDMRQTAVRLLGLLGALDPAQQQEIQHLDNSFEPGYTIALSTPKQPDTPSFVDCDLLTADLLIQFSSQQMEDYYPAVAMAALLQTLKDPAMAKHEKSAVETLGRVFEYLGPSGAPYLEQVIPALISRLDNSDLEFKQLLIQRIGQMLAQARLYARPYLTNLLTAVKQYWYTPRLQPALFDLVATLAQSLGPDFAPYVVLVAEHVSAHLFQMEELSPLVCLRELARCLHGYESLVVPGAVSILGNESSQVVQRKIACETISSLIVHLNLADYLAVIVRAILKCLSSSDTAMINEIYPDLVNLLVRIVCQTGKKFAPFEPVVSERLKAAKPQAISDRHLYDLAVTRYVRMADSGLNDLVDGENILERLAGLWPAAMQAPKLTSSPPGGGGGGAPGGSSIVTATSGAIGAIHPTNFRKTRPILANLRLKWKTDHCVSTEDWQSWLKELGVAMLKESSSTALRTCAPGILQDCPSLVAHLFNSAFLSCWEELNEASQDELMTALHAALAANSDATILHQILDLFDLFKHSEFGSGGNLIRNCIAGEAAVRCRAFAKALRHYEDEFSMLTEAHKPIPHELWASLVDVHIRMDASESAKGVIHQFEKCSPAPAKVPETWFEKLGDWRGALKIYDQRHQEATGDGQLLGELAVRRMTCLKQLGDWEAVLKVGQESWVAIMPEQQDVAAELMCSAALGLRDWDVLARYGALQVNDTHAAHMFKAAIAVTKNNWRESLLQIGLARQALTSQLATMIGEGYRRVYPHVIESQTICELEEVVAVGMNPNLKGTTKANWHMRIQNCRRQIDDWLGLLTVRGLILPVRDQEQDWLKAATISNRANFPELANRILCRLLDVPSLASCEGNFPTDSPLLALACLKQLWNEGAKEVAFTGLRRLVTENQNRLTLLPGNTDQAALLKIYLSKCYRRLANWQLQFSSASNDDDAKMRALEYYHNATVHDEKAYKAWHEWAQVNYDIVALYTQRNSSSPLTTQPSSGGDNQPVDQQQPPDQLQLASPLTATTSLLSPCQPSSNWPTKSIAQQCCVAAVKGFARSVTLRPRDTIHDLVRLMSLWFEHGEWSVVLAGVRNCIPTVPVDAWLQLIPQLIARIDSRNAEVRDSVQQLLKTVGQLRPQALVYSLSVAAQTPQIASNSQSARVQAAKMILQAVCEQNPQLVNETLMVSNELVRIAILWQERWHEGLEEASKAFYNDHNTAGMLEIIDQLYTEISRRPETSHEQSFLAMYDSELKGAKDFIDRYRRIQQQQLQPNQASNPQQVQNMAAAGNDCIVQAWHFFLNMFRKLTPQLQQMTSVELQFTSPALYQCRDLNICVPGTYDPNKDLVTISRVVPTVQVISSKQRPRKLSIFGSDGKEYVFLLKGHEDIRLDERVMQLFGLVNLLILQAAPNDKFSGTIQRVSVIPLNTNSGLIGWLPSCDTLHALIKEYRERRNVILNLEHRLMNQNCSTYDTLPIYHKMDVFEYALDRTKGDDLSKILWFKSPSSDVWFQRRQNYIRSLAVMSMVGYVLGLGDRHPSNLLLNRITGKIIHIDFGDCFEMAQKRERFPEKIPFRLTRMMVNAMEVTGIDGLFRASSEWTMRLLRQNRDSVLGVLEAFVYDPVINPRLMEQMQEGGLSHGSTSGGTANGVMNAAVESAAANNPQQNGQAAVVAAPAVVAVAAGQQHAAGGGVAAVLNHNPVAPAEAGRRSSAIINRVREKLFGRDFGPNELGVPEQVELLIEQATSTEYLCQCYVGWCPFW